MQIGGCYGNNNVRRMENDYGQEGNQKGIIRLVITFVTAPFRFIGRSAKVLLVILLVAASIGGTVYFARQRPEILGIEGQSIDRTKEETEKLIKEIGEIIALPEGEVPTLATVTDIEKVKGQTFFAKAQNGDKVLIYSSSKKAYLYRPEEKKIIEVGLVNLTQPQEEDTMENATQEGTVATPTIKPTATPFTVQTITPKPTFAPSATQAPQITP